jgi:hypothetical protein
MTKAAHTGRAKLRAAGIIRDPEKSSLSIRWSADTLLSGPMISLRLGSVSTRRVFPYSDYGTWAMSGWDQIFFYDPEGNRRPARRRPRVSVVIDR